MGSTVTRYYVFLLVYFYRLVLQIIIQIYYKFNFFFLLNIICNYIFQCIDRKKILDIFDLGILIRETNKVFGANDCSSLGTKNK